MSDRDDRGVPVTTTDAGTPAPSDEYSLTVGPDGPILLQDRYLIQKMAHFNRERVPERVVHAKGGSYGGPRADPRAHVPGWYVQGGEIMRTAYTKRRDDDDFG